MSVLAIAARIAAAATGVAVAVRIAVWAAVRARERAETATRAVRTQEAFRALGYAACRCERGARDPEPAS